MDSKQAVSALAAAFRSVMAANLSADVLREIDSKNAVQENKAVCHSHDFIDSNQVMLDAFEKTFSREFDFTDSDHLLFQSAWDVVKAEGFSK